MCVSTVHTRIWSCQICANHFTWACVLVMAIESVLTGWPNTHIKKQQTTWCVRDDGWCLVASVTFKFIWITPFLCFSLSLSVWYERDWADVARVINLLCKRREMTRQIEREVRLIKSVQPEMKRMSLVSFQIWPTFFLVKVSLFFSMHLQWIRTRAFNRMQKCWTSKMLEVVN